MKYSILVPLALALGCSYGSFEEPKSIHNKPVESHSRIERPSTAAEWLEIFPDTIDGAREVKKYPVPDSKYCLVHIRQWHNVNFELDSTVYQPTDEDKKEMERETELVQKDIYEIANFLVDRIGLETIYKESVTCDETEEWLNTAYKLMTEGVVLNPGDVRRSANDMLDGLASLYWAGKLKIKGAEIKEQNERAIGLTKLGIDIKSGGGVLEVFDFRELIVMDLVSGEENPLAVTVYGAAHAWGGEESCGKSDSLEGRTSYTDNIAEWNKEHPDKKFSLIEVTPDHLK